MSFANMGIGDLVAATLQAQSSGDVATLGAISAHVLSADGAEQDAYRQELDRQAALLRAKAAAPPAPPEPVQIPDVSV